MIFLLDLLFPPKCACCGRVLERRKVNPCPACAEGLPLLSDDQILRTGPYGLCAVAFRYEGGVRDAIRACKFHGPQAAAGAGLRPSPAPRRRHGAALGHPGGDHPAEGTPHQGPVQPEGRGGTAAEHQRGLYGAVSGEGCRTPVFAGGRRSHHRQYHGRRGGGPALRRGCVGGLRRLGRA